MEERRRAGVYPPGLEDDLEAHFRRVATHRAAVRPLAALDDRLRELANVPPPRLGPRPVDSRLPGGEAVHSLVGRLVDRHVAEVLAQLTELTAALRTAVDELGRAVRTPDGHRHPELIGLVDAVEERLSALDRAPEPTAAGVADLARRVERLERAEALRRFRPTYRAEDFEAAFRGSEDDLRDRYRPLAARFAGRGPVLDLGCGRGEMLELLRDAGVEARGVEVDGDLVDAAVARGFDVTLSDGVELLGSLPDGSLGGLVALQVVEHLTPQQLVSLVALAHEKLRPGGMAVAETVNPQSLYVYAHAYFLDPTHDRLIHPAYLAFLFRSAGFASVEIEWRSPPPEGDRLALSGEPTADANWEKLNAMLFGPQDYAVVAVK